jgi:hypothetical protein
MKQKLIHLLFGSPEITGTLLAHNIAWFTESTWVDRIVRNGQLYRYTPKDRYK